MSDALAPWARLVLKQGVRRSRLNEAERHRAWSTAGPGAA